MTDWVEFIDDFDCHDGVVTTAFKKGWSGRAKSVCAHRAVEAGAAVWVKPPKRVRFQPTVEDAQ
ncbi:hypothetical protein Q1W73_16490 [Asticcacaulis sp. ZE23SCel15]|uniref:hypothetical protein n=1 Tax=Asticcacaulis sp. ZE23SCel15 TaxID=3059027 RepID=UPI00265DCEE0|nr:hypothetical protein [Asticcacaulis sp. ZE23SCel15]WKL57242.1 hypothetical protein Q1W73_16490 [Asticcacaulis sp. ZE23SCel15]